MKKILLTLLVAVMVLGAVTSCKKTVKAIFPEQTFDLPEVVNDLPKLDSVKIDRSGLGLPDTTVVIPLHTPYDLPTITQHFNMDSIVRANTGNNFGAGDISTVKIKEFKLRLVSTNPATSPNATNNLANFETASFNFSSNSNTTAIKVATVNFDSTYSVEKVISGDGTPELRTYLNGTELYYNISASLRKHTNRKMRVSIVATLIMK